MSQKSRKRRSQKSESPASPSISVTGVSQPVCSGPEMSDDASQVKPTPAPSAQLNSDAPMKTESQVADHESTSDGPPSARPSTEKVDTEWFAGSGQAQHSPDSSESARKPEVAMPSESTTLSGTGAASATPEATSEGTPKIEKTTLAAEAADVTLNSTDSGETAPQVTGETAPQAVEGTVRPKPAVLRSSGPPPPAHVAWSRVVGPPHPSNARPSVPAPPPTVPLASPSAHPSVPPPTRPPPPVRPSYRRITPPPPPQRASGTSGERSSILPARAVTPVPTRPPPPSRAPSSPTATASAEPRSHTPPPPSRSSSTGAAVRAPASSRPNAAAVLESSQAPATVSESVESNQIKPETAAVEGGTSTNQKELDPVDSAKLLDTRSLSQGTLEPVAIEPAVLTPGVESATGLEPNPIAHGAPEGVSAPTGSKASSTVPARRLPRPLEASQPSSLATSERPRQTRLFIGLGALIILTITIAGVTVRSKSRPTHATVANDANAVRSVPTQQSPADNPSHGSPSPQEHPVTPNPNPASAEAVVASPASSAGVNEPPPGVEDTVRVAVKIRPEGARVFYRGKEVGRTPFLLELLRGERRVFEVGYPGYVSRRLVIDGTEGELIYGLTPDAK